MLCDHLVSIILPGGLKNIEDSTFAGCSALASLSLPDSLVNIGNVVFVNCSSLTSINIPKGVIDLNNCGVFAGCKNLKRFTVAWETPPIANLLTDRDLDFSQCALIVPTGTKAKYMVADNWKDFGTIVENPDN